MAEKSLEDIISENPELAEKLLQGFRYYGNEPAMGEYAKSISKALGGMVSRAKRRHKEEERKKAEDFMCMEIPVNFENAFASDGAGKEVVEHSDSIQDAFVLSVCNLARIDIEYISESSGKDMKEVISELKGSIFLDPAKMDESKFYKGWVSCDEYLSGNIMEKLKAAKCANVKYPGFFDDNIAALEAVLPPWLDADDIFVTLSSPWIPARYIEEFIDRVLNKSYRVRHDALTGSWSLVCAKGYYIDALVSVTYGTERMNAIEIIERTLNQQSIVVKDCERVWDASKGYRNEYSVNEEATLIAQEKQKMLIDEFRSWIWADDNRKAEIRRIYYEKFCCNRRRVFDGSLLRFEGLSEKVKLYDYQKNAVARIIFSPNVLLAHDVGSGKTYEMIAAGMELRRLKLAKKNLYVVPNNILGQWKKFFRMMYEKANVLIVTPTSFAPAKRLDVLKRIRDGSFDAVIMPYSSFLLIPLSPDYYVNKLNELKSQLEAARRDPARSTSGVNRKIAAVRKMESKLLKKLEEDRKRTAGKEAIYFEDLGIDRLFLDEAHNFKNVPFDTKMTNVLGLNSTGSDKCDDMADKVAFIQRQNGGGGVVFATGTPITNSISDCFIIQKYLQSGDLELLGLSNFDSWAGMFCEVTRDFEVDVDTSKYRIASRLSKFHNLPELASLLANIADFHHIGNNSEELPAFEGWTDCMVPKTESFEDFIADISVRADLVRDGRPRQIQSHGQTVTDNMLLITTDGRKGALDLRLVEDAPASCSSIRQTDSKAWKCAANVFELYKRFSDEKSAQLIFCDISVPKEAFNIYDELKKLLMGFGIPSEKIAYIHDADSDKGRNKMTDAVRKGDIRVLIGSTFKLGLGVNVQERLVAIHHIDVPWRPSDMVQREGRILRQGNLSKQVFIYRYITENSFDAYSWQLLETKQNFISRLLSDDVCERDGSDVDGTVLDYAEVKALAIGNPLIKTRVEKSNELRRLRGLQAKRKEENIKTLENISKYEKDVKRLVKRIEDARDDRKHFESQKELKAHEKKKAAADSRKELRERIFAGIGRCIADAKEEKVADCYGFDIIAPSYDLGAKHFVYLRRKGRYKVEVGNNPMGILIRIDNFLQGFDGYISEQETALKEKSEYIEVARLELEKGDGYADEIRRVNAELKDIDRKLGVAV